MATYSLRTEDGRAAAAKGRPPLYWLVEAGKKTRVRVVSQNHATRAVHVAPVEGGKSFRADFFQLFTSDALADRALARLALKAAGK